jgi:hypothetical protein
VFDSGPTVKSFAGELPYSDELFYWTPELPEIVIKQGHLIKNYLESNLDTSPFVTTKKSDLAYKTVNGTRYWIDMHGLHSIIYPDYRLALSQPKPSSIITSDRDMWFYHMEESNRALEIWKMGTNKWWQILPDYWKNDPSDFVKGMKLCWSKDYYLT